MSTLNLNTTDDTFYGSAFNPGPNDTATTMNFGGFGDIYYDYLNFDITTGPSASNVSSVILNIYVGGVSVNDCVAKVRRVTSSWVGSTLTRTNAPTDDATDWASLPSTTTIGFKTVDITSLYKSWKNGTNSNFGIKIHPTVTSNNNNGSFDSKEGTNIPFLAITYTNPPTSSFLSIF